MSTFDFTIDQGSTSTVDFIITENGLPFDLTGFSADLMARKSYGAGTTVINASTTNNKLSVDIPNGKIVMTLVPADTTSITFASVNDESVDVVYDLEIKNLAGQVYKPARGTITINREITRS